MRGGRGMRGMGGYRPGRYGRWMHRPRGMWPRWGWWGPGLWGMGCLFPVLGFVFVLGLAFLRLVF